QDDIDGLKPSILGSNQSVGDYTVSLHTSYEDAENDQNPLVFPYTSPAKETGAPHWESMTTQLFVRVVNNTTGCANYETSFDLVVNALPISFPVGDILLCDDDRDGILGGFNLESKTDELRSGNDTTDPDDNDNQSSADFVITYHTSMADANDLNSDGIDNPSNYTIAENHKQTIYFRIIKTGGANPGCFLTGEAFDLVVEALPFANDISISRQCDGDSVLDTDSQDGIFPFDTSGIQATLLNGQTEVSTYYYDENNVLIGNTLPAIFETGSQTITVRVENNTAQQCTDETTLEFIVDNSPEVYEVLIPLQCDDGLSDTDGYSEFDTTHIIQTLLTNPDTNAMQSLDDYSVSFNFIDDNGVSQNTNQLPNPFNSNTQSVVATVTNKINPACVLTKNIDFTVAALPVINEHLIEIEQCDDGSGAQNDGVTLHNLTESQSLFSSNYENEVFEYYKDADLSIKIDDPTNYTNAPLYDEIWLKIITQDGCERISKTQDGNERLKIEITVGASEIAETFMEDHQTFYTVCDDSPALDQDGIAVFSSNVLKEINDKLIASKPIFQDQNIRVTLHRNATDGLTGDNPIDLNQNFTNTSPNTQEIWARIVNIDITKFTCLGYAQVGELYVEPRPVAYALSIDRQCDGDSPIDTDSQDGRYPFDTSSILATLLTNPATGVIQDQSILTISYFNEDGTEIPAENFAPIFSTDSQTVSIRIERDPSYPNITNPDGLCYDETSLEFIVDDAPEAYPVVLAPHCDGDDGENDTDAYDLFDTSNIISALVTNPETGVSQDVSTLDITFTYIDESGHTVTGSELPNPFNTKTQTVTVIIENPLNVNCIITEEIDFIVNPLPVFEVETDLIFCLNLPPMTIGATDQGAAYTYQWVHNGSALSNTTATIEIDKGGTYLVTATTTDGTDCSRTKEIVVEESVIASLTQEDVSVDDLNGTDNNTITIDTSNLGIGDYEFALDTGLFQDAPFFEFVKPGIHTLSVRDKNGCGIAQIDLAVIGFAKFFTPNNDGYNDTWQVLGVSDLFYSDSKIYVFDRYGKLLTQLATDGQGWDGTYNGKPLPSTDYWFSAELIDQQGNTRIRKGHFSLI
ncbi:MAG: T9SS type B sorting domain-containing protein, partial [Lutibacter sp.]|nr:T9SS type B sorting domain-containing protein [Lutibacter sp.]